MNVNIGKAITLMLQNKHRVSLAGLGTFVVQSTAAHFDSDRDQLNPPSAEIKLIDSEEVDHSLIEFLSDYYEISTTQSLKYINVFVKKLKQKLDNQDTVVIKGLGEFKTNKNKLSFIANKSLVDSIYYGLTPIKMDTKLSINEQLASKTSSAIIGESLVESTVVENVGKKVAEVEIANAAKMANDQKQNSTYKSPYDTKEESKWSFLIKPLLIILGLILISVLLFRACSFFALKTDQDKVEEAENGNKTASEMNDTLQDIDSAIQDANQMGEGDRFVSSFYPHDIEADIDPIAISELKYHPKTCIIIVGSFQDLNNAAKFQILLEEKGYDTFVQAKGDMTRVGFYADCADKDLKQFIVDIRNEINPNAWYLSPRLHVD